MLSQFKDITTFVFDIDGVLTNGNLLVLNDGQMARQMNIKDGYALQLAIKKGYRILVLSGGTSQAVVQRLSKLGITDIYMQLENKLEKLMEYIKKHQLTSKEILFMGDDIPDYLPMQTVGLPTCPADAVPEIKSMAKYISPMNGGSGCVRDVIEKVLKLNGHWDIDTSIAAK